MYSGLYTLFPETFILLEKQIFLTIMGGSILVMWCKVMFAKDRYYEREWQKYACGTLVLVALIATLMFSMYVSPISRTHVVSERMNQMTQLRGGMYYTSQRSNLPLYTMENYTMITGYYPQCLSQIDITNITGTDIRMEHFYGHLNSFSAVNPRELNGQLVEDDCIIFLVGKNITDYDVLKVYLRNMNAPDRFHHRLTGFNIKYQVIQERRFDYNLLFYIISVFILCVLRMITCRKVVSGTLVDYITENYDELMKVNLVGFTIDDVHMHPSIVAEHTYKVKKNNFFFIKAEGLMETIAGSVNNLRNHKQKVTTDVIKYIVYYYRLKENLIYYMPTLMKPEGKTKGKNRAAKIGNRYRVRIMRQNGQPVKKSPYSVRSKNGISTYDKVYSAKELYDMLANDFSTEYVSDLAKGSGWNDITDIYDLISQYDEIPDDYYADDWYEDEYHQDRYLDVGGEWVTEKEIQEDSEGETYGVQELHPSDRASDHTLMEDFEEFNASLAPGALKWWEESKKEMVITPDSINQIMLHLDLYPTVKAVYRPGDDVYLPTLKRDTQVQTMFMMQRLAEYKNRKAGKTVVTIEDCEDDDLCRLDFIEKYRCKPSDSKSPIIPESEQPPPPAKKKANKKKKVENLKLKEKPIMKDAPTETVEPKGIQPEVSVREFCDLVVQQFQNRLPQQQQPQKPIDIVEPKPVEARLEITPEIIEEFKNGRLNPLDMRKYQFESFEARKALQELIACPFVATKGLCKPKEGRICHYKHVLPESKTQSKSSDKVQVGKSYADVAKTDKRTNLVKPTERKNLIVPEARPSIQLKRLPKNGSYSESDILSLVDAAFTPECKQSGVCIVETNTNEKGGLVFNTTDVKTDFSFRNPTMRCECTGITYKSRVGVVFVLHAFENHLGQKFVVKGHKGDGVLVDKQVNWTEKCGNDLIFVEVNTPMKHYKINVKKDYRGQLRIKCHSPTSNCCVTSVSDVCFSNMVYAGCFDSTYSSLEGNCGAAIVDADDTLIGIHIGTDGKYNVFSAIDTNWNQDF
jgi:hypothetical protein